MDLLREVRLEMETENLKNNAEQVELGDLPFTQMTVVQKSKAIDKTIDAHIRPMLVMDGGDLEVIDVQVTKDGHVDVFIRYMGACNGCASATTGTLFAIENVLQENLDSNIRVLPV